MKFNLDQTIAILERTPVVLRDLLEGLHIDWIQNNEGKETWSAFDIVGHLIHGEKTDWIKRVRIILERDDKHFEPFNRFAMFEASRGKSLGQLMNEFEDLRKKNIKTLKNLKIREQDLNKEGIHPDFGEVTLKQLLSTWAVHDLNHIYQISRVMAKQYKEEVGPWHQYLRIVND